MKRTLLLVLLAAVFAFTLTAQQPTAPAASPSASALSIPGFLDPAAEQKFEQQFMAVPDPARAREHLRILTAAPHMAGTPEDKQTADYVAQKFREAGLQTQIIEYKVWLAGAPEHNTVDLIFPKISRRHFPTREHVEGDPFQDDPRVVTAMNASSPSGDAEADVVYANYGRPEDFKKLEELKIDVRGKVVLVRYGSNYRGVKAYVAEKYGAAGLLIYSDPADDGYFKGDIYPKGPWRPETGVQRGSVKYMFFYPGDPTTPGVGSRMDLPDSQRVDPAQALDQPKVPTMPLSYGDAQEILKQLSGPETPRDWQGGLPFTYHVGPGPARVHMSLKETNGYRTIWDVIGTIPGSEAGTDKVVAGNHRDAWVYGAVDPNSGTAAMLETVKGLGELLKTGWKPKRTLIFGSWDAEEQGLIGSTEWAEDHAAELDHAVAYLNMDVAVSGPNFTAGAVPSLKQFMRDVAKAVPSADGKTVYEAWRQGPKGETLSDNSRTPNAALKDDVPVGDLGSGSDYTPFIQHLGVPSTDVTSNGPYGVYHSAFDNFAWFSKFADPDFLYEQQMARYFGVQAMRLGSADALPFDYEAYGSEIAAYLESTQKHFVAAFGKSSDEFSAAHDAAVGLARAGAALAGAQSKPAADAATRQRLNSALVQSERDLLIEGLPGRPWFRHAIYAPGKYTGYAAVVLPGVADAIDDKDSDRAVAQLHEITQALRRAAGTLEKAK